MMQHLLLQVCGKLGFSSLNFPCRFINWVLFKRLKCKTSQIKATIVTLTKLCLLKMKLSAKSYQTDNWHVQAFNFYVCILRCVNTCKEWRSSCILCFLGKHLRDETSHHPGYSVMSESVKRGIYNAVYQAPQRNSLPAFLQHSTLVMQQLWKLTTPELPTWTVHTANYGSITAVKSNRYGLLGIDLAVKANKLVSLKLTAQQSASSQPCLGQKRHSGAVSLIYTHPIN